MQHQFNEHGLCTNPGSVSYEGNDCEVKFFVAEQNAGWSWGYYLKTASNFIYVWPRKSAVVATQTEAWLMADRDATEFVAKLENWGRPWISELREGLDDVRDQLEWLTGIIEKAKHVFAPALMDPAPPPPAETKKPKPERRQLIPGQQLSIF